MRCGPLPPRPHRSIRRWRRATRRSRPVVGTSVAGATHTAAPARAVTLPARPFAPPNTRAVPRLFELCIECLGSLKDQRTGAKLPNLFCFCHSTHCRQAMSSNPTHMFGRTGTGLHQQQARRAIGRRPRRYHRRHAATHLRRRLRQRRHRSGRAPPGVRHIPSDGQGCSKFLRRADARVERLPASSSSPA